ncbi:hypothetical protein ACLBOM_05015 [Escherichia coli]
MDIAEILKYDFWHNRKFINEYVRQKGSAGFYYVMADVLRLPGL